MRSFFSKLRMCFDFLINARGYNWFISYQDKIDVRDGGSTVLWNERADYHQIKNSAERFMKFINDDPEFVNTKKELSDK